MASTRRSIHSAAALEALRVLAGSRAALAVTASLAPMAAAVVARRVAVPLTVIRGRPRLAASPGQAGPPETAAGAVARGGQTSIFPRAGLAPAAAGGGGGKQPPPTRA